MQNSKKKWHVLVSLWMILAFASAASARGFIYVPPTVAAQVTRPRTVTVPEGVFLELEKAAAERDHLRGIVTLKDNQIAAQGEQIAALRGLVDIERMRAESWSKAALERKEAIVIDDKRIALYEADVTRLRTERDKARSNQKWFGFVGLILGAALGAFAQK